jgi:hypothetical protein
MIYLIVEGDGEVDAAPELMRRLLYEQFQRFEFVLKPINAHGCGNIDTPGGLERFLELTRRAPNCSGVIVLRDAEREHQACPPGLAGALAQRAANLQLPFPVVIVCATCEYESWFISSLHSIKEGYLKENAVYEGDPEQECGAKGWLTRHMPEGRVYKETLDQVRMTTRLDIPHTIAHSRSFRRMAHAVEELIGAIDTQNARVTPHP